MVGELNFGILDPNAPAKAAGSFQEGQNALIARQDADQQRQMNALALQKAQQSAADDQSMRAIYAGSGGDINKSIEGLQKAGQYKQAMDLQTQQYAHNKAKMEDATSKLDVMKRLSSDVMASPTLDNAINSVNQWGKITGSDTSQEVAKLQAIGDNPLELKKWAAGHSLTAEHFMPKPVTQDVGGQILTGFQDPMTGTFTPTGVLTKTQTPESIASERTAAAARSQSATQFGQTQQLEREKMAKTPSGGAASEDERKAAGWLAQADNAYKNMLGAMGTVKAPTGAEKPGAMESILPEGMAGAVRNPNRQKFVQAASSLSESLLRAATGAGVNESEAKQKIQELTPQFWDDAQTRKQKLDAIPMYLNSLKSRSGRAAPAGYSVPTQLQDGWSVQEH